MEHLTIYGNVQVNYLHVLDSSAPSLDRSPGESHLSGSESDNESNR